MKIVVIGAGPAGLTAAYVLSKSAQDVFVYEADDRVGGMSKSFPLWGQIVDIGPHRFFSADRRVNELWLEVTGREYEMIQRQTRILYNGKMFKYPLEAFDALSKLGPIEAATCILSYGRELAFPTPQDGSFEAWVRSRFGRRLFELFFKTYSEKLWGIQTNEMDADFAAQRIKKFSLFAAIKAALLPDKGRQHRTLADQFAYPLKGTGMVYNRMADAIIRNGGRVLLNSPVRKVLVKSGAVSGLELMSGEIQACDHVISTMPITEIVARLDGVPERVLRACNKLQYRNTVLVYLEVLDENPFPDNWIYVHSGDFLFGRVTNFRNWAASIHGNSPHSILAMEYWCGANDEFWKRDDPSLSALARQEIIRSGLVRRSAKLGRSYVLRIPKSYPIYRRGYKRELFCVRDYLNSISGLQVIGRYGSFKYNNQDHSILMGRMAAENILGKQRHDLWGVNADYETYQESSSITSAGLVCANAA